MAKARETELLRAALGQEPTRGELKKLKILDTAITFLAREGVERFSLEAVARSMKVVRAQIAYHFVDKEALFEAVIRYVIFSGQNSTEKRLKSAKSAEDLLRALVEGPFDWLENSPEHAPVLILFYYRCAVEPRYRKLHSGMLDEGAMRIEGALRATLPVGKDDPDSAIMVTRAHTIQSVVIAYVFRLMTTEISRAATQALKQEAIETIQSLAFRKSRHL